MFFPILFVIPIVLIAGFTLIAMAVKILREYERAVVFTWDVFRRSRGRASCCWSLSSRKWCE